MLIDYLRYVAFEGRLRAFFQDGLFNYVEPSHTTGQHLRFAPDFLDERLGWRGHTIIQHVYRESHLGDFVIEQLKHDIGLAGGPDGVTARFDVGGFPRTFTYTERDAPRLQIIIDIDPEQWSPRYSESQAYEETPIIYRQAGPARAHFESGDRLFDRDHRASRHGTLCGFFQDSEGRNFALTCGHVIASGSEVFVERRRRIWRLRLWPHVTIVGRTRYVSAPCMPSGPGGAVSAQLDAALIELSKTRVVSASPQAVREAAIKPIAAMLQEEPVWFRGSGRSIDTLARVSAVTIRKSIDLFRDGVLRDLGDVLMLGHRYPMYIAKRVSRRGDSGAAVRQGVSSTGPFSELNQWHGMVLGSDDGGAYATYSEHLWAWAAKVTGDSEMNFVFAV